jgi:hypothetical protein
MFHQVGKKVVCHLLATFKAKGHTNGGPFSRLPVPMRLSHASSPLATRSGKKFFGFTAPVLTSVSESADQRRWHRPILLVLPRTALAASRELARKKTFGKRFIEIS